MLEHMKVQQSLVLECRIVLEHRLVRHTMEHKRLGQRLGVRMQQGLHTWQVQHMLAQHRWLEQHMKLLGLHMQGHMQEHRM